MLIKGSPADIQIGFCYSLSEIATKNDNILGGIAL